jgi:hypothetical protein
MACPNLVAEAMEGLSSIVSLSVDLDDDRFDVVYRHADDGAVDRLLAVVIDLGYEPTVVETGLALAAGPAETAPLTNRYVPADKALAAVMSAAARDSSFVLLDVYTPR